MLFKVRVVYFPCPFCSLPRGVGEVIWGWRGDDPADVWWFGDFNAYTPSWNTRPCESVEAAVVFLDTGVKVWPECEAVDSELRAV